MDCRNIRNFSIIAHIDHGKSTLADRLLEFTGTVSERELKEQMLDDMQLERDRGITIKARSVSVEYKHGNTTYQLNLIDTPGHVDFQYEVSRALTCCEGALLLVDAFQGVEAQTVANGYNAFDHDLAIIPVINKIDLDYARVDEVVEEIEQQFGLGDAEVQKVSAKEGIGIEGLLEAVIEHEPPPTGDPAAELRAMVFDSHYDEFRGAITYIRVMEGTIGKGDKIQFVRAGSVHDVIEIGQFTPQQTPCDTLHAGQVGYVICNIKSLDMIHIGDTLCLNKSEVEPLPGYQEPKRMVYCGLYPSDGQDFKELRDALGRLKINDPSFEFEAETSEALGFGFRCGFLGLLHMEIVQQRLEQESDVDLIQTAPNVTYEVTKKDGTEMRIHRPQEVPEPGDILEFRQPIVRVNFITPGEYVGAIMKLCNERRGVQQSQEYISPTRMMLCYDLPLAEVIYDLHDKLKSATRGYGTMDYEIIGYQAADLVRMDILVLSLIHI